MADGRSIRAGAAYVELFVKDNRLTKGLDAASARLKKFGVGIAAMGGAAIGAGTAVLSPLLAAVKTAEEMGSALADMSERTGVSVEALSELGYAARTSAADEAALEGGLRKMQKTIGDAATGTTTAVDALAQLGLTLGGIQGLEPDVQFAIIADKISQIQDPTMKAAAAMEIFGRSGSGLLPLMAGGAKGLAEMREQARKLGLTMSTKDAQAAEAFGDTLETLWSVIKMGAFNIGSALIPELGSLVGKTIDITKIVGDWIRENRGLFVSVAKLAAGLVAVGGVLTAVGAAFVAAGFAASGIAGAFGLVGSALGGAIAAIGAIGGVIAALATPIGAAGVAVVALAGYFVYTSGVIGKVVDWIGGVLATLQDDAKKAFGGISDALAAGDLAAAAKIAWVALRIVFQRGIAYLQGLWVDFKAFFQRVWAEAVIGAASIFVNSWAGLQRGWSETIGFLADAWTVFVNGVTMAWHTAIGFIKKAWVKLKSLVDSDVNVEAEVKRIDEETSGKVTDVQAGQDKLIAEREAARQKRAAEIESQRSGTLGELEADRQRRQGAISNNQNAQHAALEKELADLIAERDALLKKSKDATFSQVDKLDLGEQKKNLADAGEAVAGIENKTSVQGTFSAAAASLFGGKSSAMEETARNTAQLIVEEKKTRRELKGNALVAGAA